MKDCHICLKPIGSEEPKVRDHCHYTGKFRGTAHRSCNLDYKVPSCIPVVFHNMSGYDAHLFIKELVKPVGGKAPKFEVIAKNKENYISFSTPVVVDEYINNDGEKQEKKLVVRSIESFKFMASSLDSLMNNLVKGGHKLFEIPDDFKKYNLLMRKGVYPYEYMDSSDKFEETSLPLIEKFYSELNGYGISTQDYERVKEVWKEFNIKNLGDYHDLYLKTDVILLGSVF